MFVVTSLEMAMWSLGNATALTNYHLLVISGPAVHPIVQDRQCLIIGSMQFYVAGTAQSNTKTADFVEEIEKKENDYEV